MSPGDLSVPAANPIHSIGRFSRGKKHYESPQPSTNTFEIKDIRDQKAADGRIQMKRPATAFAHLRRARRSAFRQRNSESTASCPTPKTIMSVVDRRRNCGQHPLHGLALPTPYSRLSRLHLNVSKGGVSASVGRRGACLAFGKRGTRATIGLPGSGRTNTERTHKQPHQHDKLQEPVRWHLLILAALRAAAVVLLVALIGGH